MQQENGPLYFGELGEIFETITHHQADRKPRHRGSGNIARTGEWRNQYQCVWLYVFCKVDGGTATDRVADYNDALATDSLLKEKISCGVGVEV